MTVRGSKSTNRPRGSKTKSQRVKVDECPHSECPWPEQLQGSAASARCRAVLCSLRPRCGSAVVFPSPWWHRGPSLDSERPSRRPSVTVRGRASTHRLASRPSLFLRLCGDGQALDEELSAAQQRAPLPQTVQGSAASAHTRFVVVPAAAVLLAFKLRRQAAPRVAIAEES